MSILFQHHLCQHDSEELIQGELPSLNKVAKFEAYNSSPDELWNIQQFSKLRGCALDFLKITFPSFCLEERRQKTAFQIEKKQMKTLRHEHLFKFLIHHVETLGGEKFLTGQLQSSWQDPIVEHGETKLTRLSTLNKHAE